MDGGKGGSPLYSSMGSTTLVLVYSYYIYFSKRIIIRYCSRRVDLQYLVATWSTCYLVLYE